MWFLGAAASPFGAPPKFEAIRAEKKVNAGAQFILADQDLKLMMDAGARRTGFLRGLNGR